jgi:2,4-dienoyl-CoA reductase-like NADH-dependent reductase (Old Yellow Enzyme family)
MTFGKPRPLTIPEIDDLVDRWAFGAEVLYKAGADGCQLHGAHGYLLSQFLSSRVNQRTDEYGGPLENKSRIVFRVIEEIKKRVPAAVEGGFIISMKLNSADFSEG